jgi:dihydroorotate dehydrogenase (fumarate)
MSIDLTTNYLGLKLASPFMPGASPLVDNLDTVRKLEDAGAAAIVLHSLFEEQIEMDWRGVDSLMLSHEESTAEAISYFPRAEDFALTPERYLEQISAIREAVGVPVIASLNGITPGGWVSLAESMQQAGADALELNVYQLPADSEISGSVIEETIVSILEIMLRRITIPVAVKLSPFYSSLPNFARRLASSGASGLVLFNRFYQPDIDIEELEVKPSLLLSDSSELLLRLRWMAILESIPDLDFALSGGIHTVSDAIKALMSGATTVQMVSSLLQHGPAHLRVVIEGVTAWMSEHKYASVGELRGCMSYRKCPDPGGYERANYLRVLQTWQV